MGTHHNQGSFISVHSHSAVRTLAAELDSAPSIVRAAIRRVGWSVPLVKEYLAGQPNRWQSDLFGPNHESSVTNLRGRTPRNG